MNAILAVALAALSIWDYPARFPAHRRLSRAFVEATRKGDVVTMETASRKGVTLLPDDPTWHYNLACALARSSGRESQALDELELAIDLGFRDRKAISADPDLKPLAKVARFAELLDYADFMKTRPLLTGPMSAVDATGAFGQSIGLGEQNLGWDFSVGCFVARMRLSPGSGGGNEGDLYVNRDGLHSNLNAAGYPGLTVVRLDQMGHDRKMDLDIPNMLFPYPVFGNCSRAFTMGPFWRSLPRMLLTAEANQLDKMVRFYLSNQVWVFPSNADTAPVGTNGDVFASIVPYWITTAGRSYSDLPYLRAALEVSRAMKKDVKADVVRRGLLAPTIQTIIRKSLRGVTNEVAYLSARAHPTAFPPSGVEKPRLLAAAAALTAKTVPPLAVIAVRAEAPTAAPNVPELTYASAFAWAYVLRAEDRVRTFRIAAKGAVEFRFVQTHGAGVAVTVAPENRAVAKVTIDRTGLSPTNRVDIAVFGRNPGTDWGAPSYVSFARMDPTAAYSDPVLTPKPAAKAKGPATAR